MVTDFDKHWDNIPGNFTSYSSKMVKYKNTKGKLVSDIQTTFIKRMKDSDKIEQTWTGKVFDISNLSGKIYFRVEIEKEIICPKEYASLVNGWYFEFDK